MDNFTQRFIMETYDDIFYVDYENKEQSHS